jgi:D-galactarolactone cycloisomerase
MCADAQASLGVAIAGGEGLERRSDFLRPLDDGIDIVQPDVGICGGIGEACFVADLAALYGRACVPHVWGGAVLIAATVQRIGLLAEPLEVRDGLVAIPAGPGLDVEVDESAVRSLDRLAVR